jgi:4-hydroxy-tetrahydrodipicolinate reductase
VRVAVHGATGRMGQAVLRLAKEAGDVVVGAIAASDAPELGRDAGEVAGIGNLGVAVGADPGSGVLGADVVIDFSTARALSSIVRAATRARIPLVSGTTGLGPAEQSLLDDAAKTIPLLWAPNMSLGVEILAALARTAAARLGGGFDIEIVETHHSAKVDAPSGTALRLAAAVREGRPELVMHHAREGNVGPRKGDELAVVALRGGDIIGDHTIHLLGPGERIELTHRATNRDLFAHGALRAARWIIGRAKGRYALSALFE